MAAIKAGKIEQKMFIFDEEATYSSQLIVEQR